MANVRQLKDHGTPIFPITHVSLVKGMEGRALMDATYAWDGTGTPDVSKIPAGVVVTYNGTDYTGTLVASASTTGRFYLVPSTTVQGEWDRYMTDGTGSSYAWKAAGNTSIPSPDVVDNETTDDSTKSHSAAGGKRLKDQLGELEAKVDDLDNAVEETTTKETIQTTSYYTTPWTSGGGINADGDFVSVASWGYTNKIPVQEGDYVTCDRLTGGGVRTSAAIRYLCAYNGDTPVPSKGYSSEIQDYTVPSGITHIVVTQASFNSYTGQRVVIVGRGVRHWLNQDQIGGFVQTGNLASGESFTFPETNIKQYKVFCFDGNITSFSSLVLGRNISGTDKESVAIDATNITITNTYGSAVSVPHGLTIADNIQVMLKTGNRNRLTLIRIITKGDVFEYTALQNITWNADRGNPFVRSVDSVFTDCTASWTSEKMNAPIWIFGDSYLTYDPARWAYYLIADGYDASCMMNAYAGEGSEDALVAFESLISAGKRPNILVWALGMNDIDPGAINADYKAVFNKVAAICDGRGIMFIPCLIPSTPVRDNNYKNSYIRSSGYRFIDFPAGVGAGSTGVWFSGLLADDNTHPTEKGARTLYYKLLSELPEVVVSNN